jgi:hypothetical protein
MRADGNNPVLQHGRRGLLAGTEQDDDERQKQEFHE